MEWIKEFPQLWYRAKAVYGAIVLLMTGVGMVVADKAVSFDEAEYVAFLVGAVLSAWTVERTKNGPKPVEPPVLPHNDAFQNRSGS